MSSADPNNVAELSEMVDELLARGAVERMPDAEVWRLLAAAVRLYAAKREAGMEPAPFPKGESPTATDVVVAVTDLLRAADVELFELGMWQVWGKA